jgi:hypothetical protein
MAIDWSSMTDEEIGAELDAGHAEQTKRRDLEAIPEQMDALNKAYLDREGTVEGEPWRQPAGSHDAYPLDWIVTHADKTWRSLVAGNVWEPGVSGWAEEVPEGQVPAWVQPTGAHDAYNEDDQVHHNGNLWTSLVDANVWEPPQQWADEGPYQP